MIYVPVFRYRQEEKATLHGINFSDKTIPLVEIIREKPRANMNGTFSSIYPRDLSLIRAHRLMVDFPSYITLGGRTPFTIRAFLQQFQNDPMLKLAYFNSFRGMNNIIPVLSYNPFAPYIPNILINLENSLREPFPQLAFRLFEPEGSPLTYLLLNGIPNRAPHLDFRRSNKH
jgi:hypothetical protein